MPTTPYTGSKASQAMGTVASIGPLTGSTGTETFTSIGEITSADFSGAKRTVLNPTNMQSGGIVEKLDTLLDNGQCKLTMNRVTTDPGQLALNAAFVAGGKYDWEVQEPVDAELGQTTKGNLYAFSAIISAGPEFSLDPTKLTTLTYTLDISGAITITPGS